MALNNDTCYKALESRDSRFDGLFFTAVKTTGIYCRPICPAVTPKRRNVTFYPCAAAAEEAGYRPCLRCRPETSPGTPAWRGASTSVSRAVGLIDEGYLDTHAVEELGDRLGLGARHLTRLFREHLGSTPVALAQTRRAHFARNLLSQNSLPMTEVAFAAGFGSVRRFNTVMKKVFGSSPRQLRAKSKVPSPQNGRLSFLMPYRPPYDWAALLGYVAGRAIPGVEIIQNNIYARTITWLGQPGTLTVAQARSGHALELQVNLPRLDHIIDLVGKVRRAFDCGADPRAITQHLAADPLLESLVRQRPGLRLPSSFDPFEMAVRAILGQQVSVKGATTISGRLVAMCGVKLGEISQPGLTHLFPSPAALATAQLEGMGLTTRRMATLQSFARAVAEEKLVLAAPLGPEEFIQRMVQLDGIGPWTAQYVAMRALGEPDAFPAKDLGLIKAAEKLALELPLEQAAEKWRPWRSYAALHLWLSLSPEKPGEGNG